jgi:tRNA (cmo5U34)-methyltransferase
VWGRGRKTCGGWHAHSPGWAEQIRERFDNDVERFSNLETGQTATVDAPLMLDLVAETAATASPRAMHVLDIGCGAGNYTLKLLQRLPGLDATLIDLSLPMLGRAQERVCAAGAGRIRTLQGDIRDLEIGTAEYDIVLAAMVLHHLRSDAEWEAVFRKVHASLRTGGSFWIADMVSHGNGDLHGAMWARYGEYLRAFKGAEYRDTVFAYIEQEDTPRPLLYQTGLLKRCGFEEVEVLHKNNCFAAFGAIK